MRKLFLIFELRYWIQTEALRRLLRGFFEQQTEQLHPIRGTPVEVPQPSTVRQILLDSLVIPALLTRHGPDNPLDCQDEFRYRI